MGTVGSTSKCVNARGWFEGRKMHVLNAPERKVSVTVPAAREVTPEGSRNVATGEVRSGRTEPVDHGRSHRPRPERAEECYDSEFPPPLPGRIHFLHGYPRVPSRYAGTPPVATILRLFEALNGCRLICHGPTTALTGISILTVADC